LLLVIRLGVFLAAALVNLGALWLYTSLPVINRLIDSLTVLLLIWLWAFPKPVRWSDLVFVLAGILTLLLGFIAVFFWTGNGFPNTFNGSNMAFMWGLLNTLLLVAGVLLLVLFQPEGWAMGVTMVAALFAGELLQLIFPNPYSDYPFMVRLVNMAAFPLLLGLPGLSDLFTPVQPVASPTPAPGIQVTRSNHKETIGNTGIEKSVFKNMLGLLNAGNKTEVCRSLCVFIAQALVADICVFFSPPDEKGVIELLCGYDQVMQEYLKRTSFEQSTIPGISTLLRKKPLIVPQDNPELSQLALRLHLQETGYFLAMPILDHDKDLVCILGVLSPYTKYEWLPKDQEYLNNASAEIASIFHKSGFIDPAAEAAKDAEILKTQTALEKLNKQNEKLHQDLAALQAQNVSYREQTEQLITHKEKMLATDKKIEVLNLQLDAARQKIDELESQIAVQKETGEQDPEVIASMIQELRQPLSSISGYVDLLMSESVGVLSPVQRKYIDKVKASSDRMGNLISDLVRMTILEYGVIKLVPQQIELNELIDEVINLTGAQFRQRGIVLRVDLPQELPILETDKDAALQILLNLLQNASLVTPPESEIELQARLLPNTGRGEQIEVAVSDSGEGIPERDLESVFTRLQRADSPLVPGIGDSGVGLVIAKTLAEKLGGEISVESRLGLGSTFQVTLPVKISAALDKGERPS